MKEIFQNVADILQKLANVTGKIGFRILDKTDLIPSAMRAKCVLEK